MHGSKSPRIVAILLAGALAACGGNAKKPVEAGDIGINISASTALTLPPQIVYVRLYGPTTTQPGVDPAIDQTIVAQASGNVFVASFTQVPAGTYWIHAKGFSAFDAAYTDPAQWESGSPDPQITVVGGQQAIGNLLMQEVAQETFSNNAPWVSLLSASTSSVFSSTNGGNATSATLNATLVDADGDLTGFGWSDDVGGTFDPATASGTFFPMVGNASISTTWTPPPSYAGPAHLYLEVFDSVLNASRVVLTLTVVQTPGFGSAVVNVAFNNSPALAAPLVANYMPDGSGGGQIAAGGTTLLSVAAWDPNGDTLSFDFVDDCSGSFANALVTGTGTAMDPYFATVEYTVPIGVADGTTCTATANITDGNGGLLVVNDGIHIGLPTPTFP